MKSRLLIVKTALKEKNIDIAVIIEPANVRYLTGFTGEDSWVVISNKNTYLVTDSRYTEQAKKQCICKVITRKTSLPKETADLINNIDNSAKVAVEDTITLKLFNAINKNTKGKIITISGVVEKNRSIKDKTETAYIKKAATIAAAAFDETIKQAKAGISEVELAAILDFNIKKRGSTNGFSTIVAFGKNGSMPHYQPAGVKLKKNDTILIDFGATFNGYTCDVTRCFAVGKISKKYVRIYNAVLDAQKNAISVLKAGVEVAEIEKMARAVLAKHNLPQYGHGTGHGIGLNVHELPVISQSIKNCKLQAGNIITIEPAVYMAGKLGIRIEDDVIVKANGCEVLTTAVKKFTAI